MIIAMWETIKQTITDFGEWAVGAPSYTKAFETHASPVGELCPYCNSRGVGMNGYCVGCGHDRGPRQPQEIAASITDSFILGSRIEIEVT